jgi:hypothetical protein
LGTPLQTGLYDGETDLTVPLDAVTPPTPLGRSYRTPPNPGRAFHAFVLRRTAQSYIGAGTEVPPPDEPDVPPPDSGGEDPDPPPYESGRAALIAEDPIGGGSVGSGEGPPVTSGRRLHIGAISVLDANDDWVPVVGRSGSPGSTGDVLTRQADGTYADAAGGGGVSDLGDLSDVDTSGATSGDVLTFDGSDWGPAAPSGGGASALDDLTDVDTSGVSSGDVLTYDGSGWVADTPTGGGASTLDDLTDVDTSGASTGKVLTYDGSGWVPDDPPAAGDLDDLADVDASSPSEGQVLAFDGTNWSPATPADSAITDTVTLWSQLGSTLIIGPVPATATEIDGNFRPYKRIPSAGQARLCTTVVTSGPAGSKLTVQGLADTVGASWQDLTQTDMLLPLDGTGAVRTGWITLDPAAAGDRQLRIMMQDGDDTTSVELGPLWLEFSNTAPVCVEVWREDWDSYADMTAINAVYAEVDTTDSNAGTWSLSTDHVLTGTHCLKLTCSGTATTGQVMAMGRDITGLTPSTTYTIRLWYYETGDLVAGDPEGEWFLHSETAATDGSGTLTFGPIAWIGDDGFSDFEMWVGAFIVELCP